MPSTMRDLADPVMVGTQSAPAQLFYDFDLDKHVPCNHMLREIDRFWTGKGCDRSCARSTAPLGDPRLIQIRSCACVSSAM